MALRTGLSEFMDEILSLHSAVFKDRILRILNAYDEVGNENCIGHEYRTLISGTIERLGNNFLGREF
jgi:hypothetical protein